MSKKHTCWQDPEWDGTLSAPGKCEGCDEAAEHPCNHCGYGHLFTTHNPEAHWLNGDDIGTEESLPDEWFTEPR